MKFEYVSSDASQPAARGAGSVRVLFLIPPYGFDVNEFISDDSSLTLPAFTIPYGILSMDSYIKSQCRDAKILDLNVTEALVRLKIE